MITSEIPEKHTSVAKAIIDSTVYAGTEVRAYRPNEFFSIL
jgi:hypothetical protein